MSNVGTFGRIWLYRKQILEGIANTVVKKQFVETVAAYRMSICKKCTEYGGKCLVPGTGPCCGACGCSLEFKVRSMSTACGLSTIKKQPLWFPVLSKKDDEEHLSEIEDEGANT